MRRLLGALGAAVLLVGACSVGDGAASQGSGGHFDSPSKVLGDADEGIEGVQAVRVYYPSPPHRPGDIRYGLSPPAGGLHDVIWFRCGFYDQPIREENAVHDLEHGVVWLSFAPGLADADVEVIHDLARDNPKVLAAPYEGLGKDVAVVATAWARQLTLASVDDPRLAEFVQQYQDGPQAPEQGGDCSQGLGEPID